MGPLFQGSKEPAWDEDIKWGPWGRGRGTRDALANNTNTTNQSFWEKMAEHTGRGPSL